MLKRGERVLNAIMSRHGADIIAGGLACAVLLKSSVLYPKLRAVVESGIVLPAWTGLPVVSSASLPFLFVAWIIAAVCLGMRVLPRLTGPAVLLGLLYPLLLDMRLYGNHLFLMCLFVTFVSVGISARPHSARMSRDAIWAFRAQLSVVYFFAAISKLNDFYLSGAALNNLWSEHAILPLPDDWRTPTVLAIPAALSVMCEMALAWMLWMPRFRTLAVLAGVSFHFSILLLIPELEFAVFGMMMTLGYVSFYFPIEQIQTRSTGCA